MENNIQTIVATLVLPVRGNEILLGMKKRGLGVGKWNGFGGKIKAGETIEDCARRETEEECGLRLTDLEKAGYFICRFNNGAPTIEGHIFRCREWQGEPEETEEMKPQWFKLEDIPYDNMWLSDSQWLPLFLAGTTFKAEFVITVDDGLESCSITPCEL